MVECLLQQLGGSVALLETSGFYREEEESASIMDKNSECKERKRII